METLKLSYDVRMYLGEDICKLVNNLSSLDNDWKKTFYDLLNDYVPPIVKKNESDCFNFHMEEIKHYLKDVYNDGNRPSSFTQLLDSALDAYLCEKVIINMDVVAYNFLINLINDIGLQRSVSYEMVDIIASNANEYTSPQELASNLRSMIED